MSPPQLQRRWQPQPSPQMRHSALIWLRVGKRPFEFQGKLFLLRKSVWIGLASPLRITMRTAEALFRPLCCSEDSTPPSEFLDFLATDKFRSTCSVPFWVYSMEVLCSCQLSLSWVMSPQPFRGLTSQGVCETCQGLPG